MRGIGHLESLSDIVITILCAVLVFEPMTAVSLSGYAATTTNLHMEIKLSTVVKMLVDNAMQEFQNNNINNTITPLQKAEQELLSSLPTIVNNTNNNNIINVSKSMAQALTVLLLVKNTIQTLDSGDYAKGQQYLNSAEQELGKNILDVSSSPSNPHTNN